MKKDSEPPSSNLMFKVSNYLGSLAKKSAAVRKQFYPSVEENVCSKDALVDPLLEESHVLVKGLVQKYPRRVLLELTLCCASYCRFCTRRRKVTDIKNGSLTFEDIDRIVDYLNTYKDINEVIISGGDPLTVPDLLIYTINKLKKMKQLTILRVHTRVPVSNPLLISKKIVKSFSTIKKQAFYVSIHFEHFDELTSKTINAIKKLRKTGAILLSQSVFLKGVNDSVEVLKKLFCGLVEIGVKPYYIYRCDPVVGAEHFIVPFEKEVKIMTKLRGEISGLAYPTYVVDTPNGSGKIPVPLDFWKFDKSGFKDFRSQSKVIYGP